MRGPETPPREPTTLADLHLPPNFVADHGIRTLAYHGALAPTGLARQWRVPEAIAADVVESLKAAGLVDLEAGQRGFERSARVRLTGLGEARVEAARRRTWYAGPLPVSLASATARMHSTQTSIDVAALDRSLDELALSRDARAEIGQAVGAASVIALAGAAQDEHSAIAAAVGSAASGTIEIPYAIFAAGSVLRMYDARWHQSREKAAGIDDSLDVLRTRSQTAASQWASIAPPAVILAGGIRRADATAAFDEDARFYVAPPPANAHGGLLAVFDADTSLEGVAALARHWLVPGRHGCGIVTLRTGERIELPWRATTLLLSENPIDVPGLAAASPYLIDITRLGGDALPRFLARRLTGMPAAIEPLAATLARSGTATRPAAARAVRYVRERAAFEGRAFAVSDSVLESAVAAAAPARSAGPRDLRSAA